MNRDLATRCIHLFRGKYQYIFGKWLDGMLTFGEPAASKVLKHWHLGTVYGFA